VSVRTFLPRALQLFVQGLCLLFQRQWQPTVTHFALTKGLILEISAHQIFNGGDLTFMNSKQTSIKNSMSFLWLHLVSDLYLWSTLWRQALLIEFVGEEKMHQTVPKETVIFICSIFHLVYRISVHWLPCFFPTGKKGFGKRECVFFILFFPLVYFLQCTLMFGPHFKVVSHPSLVILHLPVYKFAFSRLKIGPKNCSQLIHGSKTEIKKVRDKFFV